MNADLAFCRGCLYDRACTIQSNVSFRAQMDHVTLAVTACSKRASGRDPMLEMIADVILERLAKESIHGQVHLDDVRKVIKKVKEGR